MPPIEVEVIYNLNDNLVRVQLWESLTQTPQNAAEVTFTLIDESNAIVGGINQLSCDYVPNSAGMYQGQIQQSFDEPPGYYVLLIDANQDNRVGHWKKTVQVKDRRWDDL